MTSKMKMTLKMETTSKMNITLKKEDFIKNEDDLKNEHIVKNEKITKMNTFSITLPEKIVDDSKLDWHSATDPKLEMLSAVQARNRIRRDERNVPGIGNAYIFKK